MTRSLLVLVFAFACGDDAAVDGGTDVGIDAPGFDAPGVDAPGVDAGVDARPERCGECSASAPWACETCLPTPLQEISAVELDGRIWVVGGFNGMLRVEARVRIFDPATNEWSDGPELPDTRHHVQLATFEGDFYVFGGMRAGFEPLDTVYVLRSGASEWEQLGAMPSDRAAGVAGRIGDRIYIAGGQGDGRNDDERLNDAAPVFIFDPSDESWDVGAEIPSVREHCAGFVLNDELYVVGGRPLSLEPTYDTVEVYDPATNEWRSGPPMPTRHGGFAATVLDGVAYVSGGEERDQALTSFEAFDGAEWTRLDDVPTPRHGHAMAALDGRVFVIGGADNPVFSAVDAVESFTP